MCVDGDPPYLCEGCMDKSKLRRETEHYPEFCDNCRAMTAEELEEYEYR